MNSPLSLDIPIPDGLPDWLATFLREVQADTVILHENGAAEAVAARTALVRQLVLTADRWLNEELDASAAAREAGRSTETIRRAVRSGRLPDSRTNPKGHIAVLRRDLQKLAAPGTDSYDATADAQDIARLRRKA